MKLARKVSVGLLSLIFVVALVSAIPVDAKKDFSVYRWWNECYYTFDPEWTGDIWTEDGKHGTFYWDNLGYFFLGPEDDAKVQKFWGIWWIDWDDGGYIEGTHDGSFAYAINQYTINGHITITSDDWSFLDGRKVHTVGNVDWVSMYSEGWFQIN